MIPSNNCIFLANNNGKDLSKLIPHYSFEKIGIYILLKLKEKTYSHDKESASNIIKKIASRKISLLEAFYYC